MVFGFLPGLGGALSAWACRNIPLSGALAAGLWGLIFLLPTLPLAEALVFVWPFLLGAAVGATTSALLLWLRPNQSLWGRLTLAFALAVIAGLFLLTSTFGGA